MRRISKSLLSTYVVPVVMVVLFVSMSVMFIACEVESKKEKNSYLYKVTLQNLDGTTQQWMAGPDVKRDNGFVVWKDKNEGTRSISGTITIEPILIPKPKPEPKKEDKEP